MKELMISCVVLLFAITYSHAGPFDPAAGLVVLQISQGQNYSYDSDDLQKSHYLHNSDDLSKSHYLRNSDDLSKSRNSDDSHKSRNSDNLSKSRDSGDSHKSRNSDNLSKSRDSDHAEKEDGILLVNGPVGAGGGDEVVSP